jgi:hypothetical protein
MSHGDRAVPVKYLDFGRRPPFRIAGALMSSAPDSFQAEDLVKDAIGKLRHARRNTLIHTVVDGLQVGP